MSGQKRIRRTFTEEFKLGALRLVMEEGKTVQEVSRDLGIAENLLYIWRKDLRGRSVASDRDQPVPRVSGGIFPGHGKLTPQDEEVRKLKRQLAIVTEEREILKKATVFFAKESR